MRPEAPPPRGGQGELNHDEGLDMFRNLRRRRRERNIELRSNKKRPEAPERRASRSDRGAARAGGGRLVLSRARPGAEITLVSNIHLTTSFPVQGLSRCYLRPGLPYRRQSPRLHPDEGPYNSNQSKQYYGPDGENQRQQGVACWRDNAPGPLHAGEPQWYHPCIYVVGRPPRAIDEILREGHPLFRRRTCRTAACNGSTECLSSSTGVAPKS